MFNVRLAGDHLYGKWLFIWLSLMVSLMVSYFVLSLFPRDVLDVVVVVALLFYVHDKHLRSRSCRDGQLT